MREARVEEMLMTYLSTRQEFCDAVGVVARVLCAEEGADAAIIVDDCRESGGDE